MRITQRKQTNIEEKLNSISHGIAALSSIIGFIALIIISATSNKDWAMFSALIYGFSLVTLYVCSTLYHLSQDEKTKHTFRILDHCSIFLLIAGSYTPILLLSLGGETGWLIFGIQWMLVLIGIILKIKNTGKHEALSILLYIIMGWLIVFKWNDLISSISNPAFNLLLYGGIIYTVGIMFYLLDSKIKYFHFIWHLFVIMGSTMHYIMIFKYVII